MLAREEDPEDIELESRVSPEELAGCSVIWRVATESTSKQVIDAAARLLVQLHHSVASELEPRIQEFDGLFVSRCFAIIEAQRPVMASRTPEQRDKIQAALASLPAHASTIQTLRVLPAQERRIVRALFLLRQMIRASEKHGTHGLVPHAALSKGSFLGSLQVTNNITQGEGSRSRIEIGMDSNATVWDLKRRIGEEVAKTSSDGGKTWSLHSTDGAVASRPPVHPATIRLFQLTTSSDLRDPSHGSTLSELKFKPNEGLGAFRKSAHLYRKASVVEDDPESGRPRLTHRAEKVVAELYHRFAVKSPGGGLALTLEACAEFTRASTASESIAVSDPRVSQLFEKYDSSGSGVLSHD